MGNAIANCCIPSQSAIEEERNNQTPSDSDNEEDINIINNNTNTKDKKNNKEYKEDIKLKFKSTNVENILKSKNDHNLNDFSFNNSVDAFANCDVNTELDSENNKNGQYGNSNEEDLDKQRQIIYQKFALESDNSIVMKDEY